MAIRKSGFSMVLAVVACAAFTACSLAPNQQRPKAELPQNWQLSGSTTDEQGGTWWSVYKDEKLNALIQQALSYNHDIEFATARVEEARAIASSAKANRMPDVSVAGGASLSELNMNGASGANPSDNYILGGLLSYEIDLWGRLANADKSAREKLLAEEANARAVALGVTAETATNYFELSALNEQIGITQKTITTRRNAYDLEKKRLDRGDVDFLVVRQAEAEWTSARARLPALEQQKEIRLSALSVLLGKTPREIIESKAFPSANKTSLPDLPSLPKRNADQIVISRPDIMEAEHQLTAANADIGVARAAYLPSLSVSGLLGATSGNLDDLFRNGSRSWSMGANSTGPLLDFGRARAQVDAAKAREKQAYISYEKTVQIAFREIRDALTARAKMQEQSEILEKRVGVLKDAARLARKRFDAGYSSYIDVLDTERSLFDAKISQIDAKQKLIQSSVDLSKALGGGI